jgi:hypothetical protein
MLKKLFIASTLLLLTACNDPFEGVLSVKHPMNVLSDKKAVHVPAGDSQAKLEFASKQKIVLKLVNAAGVKTKLVLETPSKLNFPNNTPFEFSPAQLNQNFGATGLNQESVSATPTQSGYEQCQYQRRETVCYPSGPNGQVQCRHEYRTVWGRQYVEFYDRTTHQDLTVNFVSASKVVLATFTGHRHYSERIYRHQGQCW